MHILMINKFLHPNGGAETYMFRLGEYLRQQGHRVEYFGMDSENRIVGNRANAYTEALDFHENFRWRQLTYPLKTIYSREARKKLRQVLEDLQPEVCHLNNFHYQLTPSILLEIRKWQRQRGKSCRIIYTAHDYQLICPNHLCRNPLTGRNCEACLKGNYFPCIRGRCIHGSLGRSILGAAQALFWDKLGVYKQIDTIICCSHFLKTKLDANPLLAEKTVAVHNFVETAPWKEVQKKDYVLYFGRYAQEKGVGTLLRAAEQLPQIPFLFAGTGPLENLLEGIPNGKNLGFQQGEALERLIREARFTVCPSECYENCSLSVMESQMYGTPVLAADIGGIPELLRPGETGELFESGNLQALKQGIEDLWNHPQKTAAYSRNCRACFFYTAEQYYTIIKDCYAREEMQWQGN